MSLRSLCVVGALALTGCAAADADLRPYSPPAPPPAEQTLAELAEIRGFVIDAPVPVLSVDDATFLRAAHALRRSDAVASESLATFYGEFALGAVGTDVAAMGAAALDRDLSGFYDPSSRKLYVRQGAGMDRLILAHEEEHALQDRFFGIPDLTRMPDADEALAARALFEGEATAVSLVLAASRDGTVPAVAIANLVRATDKDDATLLRGAALHVPKGAPPLLKAELAWPYLRGLAFVAQLAESGGWALVNEALRNPPKTTEQVLHVEKYLAGERAIEVRPPAVPEGYALSQSGHMGELRTRFFLAECMKDEEASAAARGWGGDAFTIAASGDHRVLLWSTAWDDEASAVRFQAALERRKACPGEARKPPFQVVRDGARVAFAQGFDEGASVALAARLLTRVGRTPPSVPPVGAVTLVTHPPIDKDFLHTAHVVDGRLEAPALGLQTGLAALQSRWTDALEMLAVGDGVSVSAGAVFSPPGEAAMRAMLRTFVEVWHKEHPKDVVLDAGGRRVRLAWTTARARVLKINGREMRFVLAPACDGQMTLMLMTACKPSTVGETVADEWLDSVRVTDDAPACRAVRTLRDPRAPEFGWASH